MQKTLVKFMAVAVACAGLAIFWHAVSMEMPMGSDDGMSASCLTVCLGGTAQASPAVSVAVQIAAFVMFIVLVVVVLLNSTQCDFVEFFHKDRHRYLMKTMVMRR